MFSLSAGFIAIIFILEFNDCNTQCSESTEWYYDSTMNDTCVFEECVCEPIGINGTDTQICTKYPVTKQSSMAKFKEQCDDVANAGCEDVNDLQFARCGSNSERCTLYCGCNVTSSDADNDLYYEDVDVYQKTCYSCQCEEISSSGNTIEGWNCGTTENQVSIVDDDWDTWMCPEQQEKVLECYRKTSWGNGKTDDTCSGNETFCYYESTFDIDNTQLNWNYTTKDGNDSIPRNTSDDFSCIDGWYCKAMDANNTHKCADINITAYNVRECDNYTIDSFNIQYLREIECCQTDFCNTNYSQPNCTYDDTLQEIEETIESCKNSIYAVNSISGHYRYCYTSTFFDTQYHYCEWIASYATFDLGCTYCEGYSTWYNDKIVRTQIDIFNEKEVSQSIDDYIDSESTCCEIEYSCDYESKKDSKVTVELTKYFVSFQIQLNNTDETSYDESDLLTNWADEMGILEMEINITNVEFGWKTVSIINGTENVSLALVDITVLIWCELAADQFVIDLEEGNYDFGADTVIKSIPEKYDYQVITYTTSADAYISDTGDLTADTTVDNDDGNGSGGGKSSTDSESLDGGAIAGVVIGILVFIAIIIGVYWYFVMRPKSSKPPPPPA